VNVAQAAKGRYLTIAITDANDGATYDHGDLGDAFLTRVPPSPVAGTLIGIQ